MALFITISLILSGYVVKNMDDEDKVRYFMVLGAAFLICFLPKILTGSI